MAGAPTEISKNAASVGGHSHHVHLQQFESDLWVRVYVDGKFYNEGHSLTGLGGSAYGLTDLLATLGIKLTDSWVDKETAELYNEEVLETLAQEAMAKS